VKVAFVFENFGLIFLAMSWIMLIVARLTVVMPISTVRAAVGLDLN
jgi:hypothetical protein